MHYFTGNMFTGCWIYLAPDGIVHSWMPAAIQGKTIKVGDRDVPIVWQLTEDSGSFYWPHIKEDSRLVELMYEDGE